MAARLLIPPTRIISAWARPERLTRAFLFAPPDAGIGMLIGGAMLIAEVLMFNRIEFL